MTNVSEKDSAGQGGLLRVNNSTIGPVLAKGDICLEQLFFTRIPFLARMVLGV